MKILEKIFVIFILIVLVTPAIQKEYPIFQVKKLDGDFVLAQKPVFSWSNWYNGSFQSAFDKYLEDHIGFRDILVRIINQIDYSLFRIPHAEGIVIGKNDQLYEYDYIRAYVGEDYIGEENIDRKIRKLKFIQEYLKKEKNIDLVLVFEPGKASFYPENIPDRYLDHKSANTNFNSFLNKAIEYEVNFIDFKAYFKSLKGTTKYPLYPQYGIHWSIYGMSYAVDSLMSYVEDLRKIELLKYYTDSLQIEKHARRPDYDIGKTLNLLFRLNETEKLAYPVYSFEENTDKQKPMVLTISDSYYWNIFNTRIPKHLYQNEAFWYFNKKIYPDSYFEPKSVRDINLKEEIEKQDIIFLMITERFLFKFGWNFIEDVYKLYGPSSVYDKLHDYKCNVWNYNVWFTNVIEDAKKRNISLEEMLYLVAEYTYSMEDKENLLMLKGVSHFEERIKHDSRYLNAIEAKAVENHVSLNDMIRQEAMHGFETNYPEILVKYNELENFKQKIEKDSLLLSTAQQYAQKYYLTLDESIQITAEKMFVNANSK